MSDQELLSKLKVKRFNQLNEKRYEGGRLQRLIYRFKKISAEKGAFSAFVILTPLYARFLMIEIGKKVRESVKNRKFRKDIALINMDLDSSLPSDINMPLVYSIKITGGLGDALMVARFVRDFQNEIDGDAYFDVYAQSPGIVSFFYENIPGFRKVFYQESYSLGLPGYDFSLIANQFVTFNEQQFSASKIVKRFPKVLEAYSVNSNIRTSIEKYISVHPYLDGAFADVATKQGKKRYSYLHEMVGIKYSENKLDLTLDEHVLERLGIASVKYITIHDGWDNNFNLAAARPTKALPYDTWVTIVDKIKEELPGIKIVQLGGKTGANIPGVDFNFRNRIKFKESAAVIAGSLLHIDAESGLVHLGAALGTKCLVAFGPTNIDWFGYDTNINIAPSQCGNCWWSSDTWMDSCPLGYAKPVCTLTQDPDFIAKKAIEYLKSEISS